MQGQRSAIGSLPDSINFDYGSTSSNMGTDQQICWNTLCDPAESRLSEFRIAPGGSDSIMGTVSHEGHNRSRWSMGEPSSSNHQNIVNHDERMTQNGWSSSMRASAGTGSRMENQVDDAASIISRNGVNLNLNSNQVGSSASFFRTSNSGSTSQSHDISLGQLGQVGDLMECSHPPKSGELEHRLIPSSSGTSELFASSGSGGFLVDEDDGRPGYSLDGRRLSCKRKTIEGNAGQPSSGGSYFSREGSMWQAVPLRSDPGSSSSRFPPQVDTSLGVSIPDPENPRLRLSMGGVPPESSVHAPTVGIGAGTSRRNYRVRMNPTSQQDSFSNNLVFPRATVGHSDVPVGHQPLRFAPVIPSPGLAPTTIHPENATPEGQPVVLRLPGSRRNVQSVRWSVASSTRAGSSSVPVTSVEMDPPLHEDLNSRPMPRNISEHPMFMPSVEARNASPSPHNATGLNLNGGGLGTSRHPHIASSSRIGPGSSSRSSSGPTWGSNRSPSQYSRRLSEYVRRSLLSSAGSEIGSTSAQGTTPSQEAVLPSAGVTQGQNLPFSRSALWMDRRGGDGVIGVPGVPYSLRTLAAGGEGRSRLVSEIRNVLDIMRRGEGLRFEDVMILDPSVLFGMADIRDQHRDMRLDIDNMSYEELLALEERIGNVNTGLTEEKITARLKRRKHSSVMKVDQAETEPCCVCQEEYNDGEDLGVLDCGHDFHAVCIKQWLAQKNSCPICKTTGLAT